MVAVVGEMGALGGWEGVVLEGVVLEGVVLEGVWV
jgi:hypothetical protein